MPYRLQPPFFEEVHLHYHISANIAHRILKLQAARIAVDHKLSGYDAIYAACAKLMSGIWVTADEKAHSKISKLKISRVLK